MKFYIYVLSCDGKPFYVGKGTGKRMYVHLQNANKTDKKSPVLDKIRKMNKLGKSIEYSRIFYTNDSEEAYLKESETIKIIGRRNLNNGPLLNLTDGGEGVVNYVYTDEHKKKLSISVKKAIKEKRFDAFANLVIQKGKVYTDEEKHKLSESVKAHWITDAGQKQKEEMSKRTKGKKRILSDEARRKMSEGASKGNKKRFENK